MHHAKTSVPPSSVSISHLPADGAQGGGTTTLIYDQSRGYLPLKVRTGRESFLCQGASGKVLQQLTLQR